MRKQFGYTIASEGKVQPLYYGGGAHRCVGIQFGVIGETESILAARVNFQSDYEQGESATVRFDLQSEKPNDFAIAAEIVKKFKTDEEGKVTLQSFLNTLKSLTYYVSVWRFGNIPVAQIGKVQYKLPYWVDSNRKYAAVFADSAELAKVHFMRQLAEAGDTEVMDSWASYGLRLDDNTVTYEEPIPNLESVFRKPTLDDCEEADLEKAREHKADLDKRNREYEEKRRKEQEEAEKAKQESESQEEVSA